MPNDGEAPLDSELAGEDEAPSALDNLSKYLTTGFFYVVAGCILYVGFLVAFEPKRMSDHPLDALYFFLGAAGVILARELIYLFPKIRHIKAPGVEVDIAKDVKKLKRDVAETKHELVAQTAGGSVNAERAKEAAEGRGPALPERILLNASDEDDIGDFGGLSGVSSFINLPISSNKKMVADGKGADPAVPTIGPIKDRDDVQRGRFGGSPESAGRILSASVKADGRDWFKIQLTVQSRDGAPPIEGYVTFYLHQSFPSPKRTVMARNGKAQLVVHAYGAFTVGVVLDEGKTLLELNLAQLDGVPQAFKDN